MPYASVNGITIYYEEQGEGEPLLLIGGLGANLREWWNVLPVYSREFHVITFDNRGSGRTDKPEEAYSIARFADDAAALLDLLAIPSALVYGSSMGGFIAQELAIRHPDKVRALVLGCTTPGSTRSVVPDLEVVHKLEENSRLPKEQGIPAGWSLGYTQAFIDRNRDLLWEKATWCSEYATPPEAFSRQMEAALQHDTLDRLGQITAPTLVITGENDIIIPAANSRLLAEGIPGAELVMLAGVGHGYALEAQEEADRAVLGFLRRHSGRRANEQARAAGG